MDNKIKVSILIPCYNSEMFLKETILSCINQDYQNIEIVIVDDGSKDKSYDIAKEWASRYNNIKVFQQPNSGACRARNLAFEKSSGDYIMYLDADDVISSNKISQQIASLRGQSSMSIATCRWARFQDSLDNCTYEPILCANDYELGRNLLYDLWETGEMFAVSAYLVPRQIICNAGKWLEDLKKNQDGEFFSRVLLNCSSVVFCPDCASYYRTGEYDSVSKGNNRTKIEALLYSFEQYKCNVLKVDDSINARNALAQNFSLFRYLYNGEYSDLSKKAQQHIKDLGVKTPICGTKRVRMLSKIIGFENFLILRKLFLKK